MRGGGLGSGPAMNTHQLRELGQQLRVDSVRAAAAAESGHPTSSMSAADLLEAVARALLNRTRTAEPDLEARR
jgi:transketolase